MSLLRFLFSRREPDHGERPAPAPVVLCVDDDREALTALNDALRRETWQVLSARSASEALDAIARTEPTVLVAAQRLADGSGVALAEKMRLRWPQAACVVITGHEQLEEVAEAMLTGTVDRCMITPWREAELLGAVRECMKREPPASERRPARPTTRSFRISRTG